MIDVLKTYGLDTNPELEAIGFTSEEDWLKLRTKGIGGSDIGAIMGINKYSSPLQVYKAKVEGFVKDLSDKVVVKKGKDLESLIRGVYVAPHFLEMGYDVVNMSHHMIINKKYPFLRANLDGVAISKKEGHTHIDNFVIEIKFVSEWAGDNWEKDEYLGVPASYYAQVQEYMLVTGMRKAYVCALFEKTWEVKFFEIPADRAFMVKLLKAAKSFYEYNMGMKIPPKYVTEIDKEDIIKAIDEKDKEEPKPLIKDASLNEKAFEYNNLYHEIKDKEKELAKVKDELVNAYMEGRIPAAEANSVKISHYTQARFDSAKFKEDQPELYKQYAKESETLKVTIK